MSDFCLDFELGVSGASLSPELAICTIRYSFRHGKTRLNQASWSSWSRSTMSIQRSTASIPTEANGKYPSPSFSAICIGEMILSASVRAEGLDRTKCRHDANKSSLYCSSRASTSRIYFLNNVAVRRVSMGSSSIYLGRANPG